MHSCLHTLEQDHFGLWKCPGENEASCCWRCAGGLGPAFIWGPGWERPAGVVMLGWGRVHRSPCAEPGSISIQGDSKCKAMRWEHPREREPAGPSGAVEGLGVGKRSGQLEQARWAGLCRRSCGDACLEAGPEQKDNVWDVRPTWWAPPLLLLPAGASSSQARLGWAGDAGWPRTDTAARHSASLQLGSVYSCSPLAEHPGKLPFAWT